ncbi:MAG: SoxY-related AACIE arm protein [Rhodoferax sp.]|nr:SoxY-related AACIE arm protein [Rhodoferax sp.]
MQAPPSFAPPNRRQWLVSQIALGACVLVRPAHASPDALQRALQSFAAGVPIQTGRVQLAIASMVDNGNTVPVTVVVDSPMTERDHVTEIAMFSERNPLREVVKFQLGVRAGRAQVSTRIRLATSQTLVALARMRDGSVWSHAVEVIVSIAACIEEPS